MRERKREIMGGGGGTQGKKDTVTRAGKKKRSEKRVNNIELPKDHKKSYRTYRKNVC